MSSTNFRLAQGFERERIVQFVNDNFDWKLPSVNLPEYFNFYYHNDAQLQFAVAEQESDWLSVVGYIRAANAPNADIWVSVWVAKKGHNGVGLELMNALPGLTGAGVVACNNIRANTLPLYHFLGWTAERTRHFYRLASLPQYNLAAVENSCILPVCGDLHLDTVSTVNRLLALGLPKTPHTPKKDAWYLIRRYFEFPHQEYTVYSACENGTLLAYLVARIVDSGQGKVLRIVDFIGEDAVLPRLGQAIDGLLAQSGAEYAELYCAGLSAELLAEAGFCERTADSADVLPNYLTPPLHENTDYYYFTNQPEQFVLFKADGDQDRPNISAD